MAAAAGGNYNLEPVDELADEEANYLSRSPKTAADMVDNVEILATEVQLFDGADGGEES